LRRNPLAAIGLLIFLVFAFVSIAAPAVSRYEPKQQQIAKRLQPPNTDFIFGSDQLGRDIQTRVFHAGRTSLPAGVLVVVVAAVIGAAVGAVAAFAGGWADEFTMRITEVFLAFPTIILAMTIAAALGPNLLNAVIAMVVVWWPNYTRLVRAQVLQVKSREFVEAARALGAPESRILLRNMLPNCLAPIIVLATGDPSVRRVELSRPRPRS
jgi:peptide/nickel transport system permease protein